MSVPGFSETHEPIAFPVCFGFILSRVAVAHRRQNSACDVLFLLVFVGEFEIPLSPTNFQDFLDDIAFPPVSDFGP